MFAMPSISARMNQRDTVAGDPMMPKHMKAMVGTLHRLMAAQIARIRRYLWCLRCLILLLRIRRLLRTSHAKFDVILLKKLELGGLAQFSRKSMEFDELFLDAEFVASKKFREAGLTN